MTVDDDYDWDEFQDAATNDYSVIWSESRNYYQNCEDLISRVMYHDEIYILKQILAAYTCFHSIAADFSPILFLSGQAGTGKSNLTNLMACLRGMQDKVLGGSSTFASVRNALNKARWKWRPEDDSGMQDISRTNEKPSMLFWADIKAFNLQDPKMYGLLRNGTSRSEDKLTIATDKGKNLEFYVFAPKVISSIEDFYTRAEFSELKRRLVLVRTQKLKMDDTRANQWLESTINPSDYTWMNIGERFKEFWDRERLHNLAALKKTGRIGSKLKKAKWDSDSVTAYSDIVLQHTAMCEKPLSEVIDVWTAFLELQAKWMQLGTISMDGIVRDLVKGFELQALDIGLPVCRIPHNDIHNRLVALRFKAFSDQIVGIMNVLGYTHEYAGSALIWVKSLD